jgi:hypothetical protein
MKFAKKIVMSILRYHLWFRDAPIFALLAIPGYLLVMGFVGVGAGLLGMRLSSQPGWTASDPGFVALVISAILILCACSIDLILIQFIAIFGNIRLGDNRFEILRIAQAVVLMTFLFAAVYYYMQLFSDGEAFNNMHPIDFETTFRKHPLDHPLEAIIHRPPLETVTDCLYFSVMTITTVGYGDIHPVTPKAKVVCMVEIVLGYLLLVLSIGAIAGNTNKETSPTQGSEVRTAQKPG